MKGLILGQLKIKFDKDGKTRCECVDTFDDKEIRIKNDLGILKEHQPLSIIVDNTVDRNSKKKKTRNIDQTVYELQLLALQIRIAELVRSNKKVNQKG